MKERRKKLRSLLWEEGMPIYYSWAWAALPDPARKSWVGPGLGMIFEPERQAGSGSGFLFYVF
jgi:hypothetical protein